jgi:hypothetical protein
MFDHSKIDFEVEKVALAHGIDSDYDYHEIRSIDPAIGSLIRRKDTKEPFAVVKGKYEMQQYTPIVSDVEAALRQSGMDLTNATFKTNVYKNGGQLELRAKFPAEEVQIGDNIVSDVVVPEFVFRTSHDGTWANNGMMGLWRSVCWNTLVSGDKLAYVYGRHTKGFNLPAFASKIKNAGEYIVGDGLTKMRHWYHTKLPRNNAIRLFSETLAKKTDNVSRKNKPNKVVLSHLMKIFDKENQHIHGRSAYEGYGKRDEGSLWTAYQAATHWSTHTPNSRSKNTQNVRVMREERVRKMLQSNIWKNSQVDYYEETGEVI